MKKTSLNNSMTKSGKMYFAYKLILFFFVLCSAILILSYVYADIPGQIDRLFCKGNELFSEGDYEEALQCYIQIFDNGYTSGPLLYNIGNCYFKLGSLGNTVLYYERAKKLMPNDPDLMFNLDYVNTLLNDPAASPRKNWFLRIISAIMYTFSVSTWLILSIILWFLLCFAVLILIGIKCMESPIHYIIIILSVLLIFSLCNGITLLVQSKSPQAIIVSGEISVRYGPGVGEVEAFLLHEGTKIYVKNSQNQWLQIQLPDGKTGWLPEDSVKII